MGNSLAEAQRRRGKNHEEGKKSIIYIASILCGSLRLYVRPILPSKSSRLRG